MNTTVEAPVLEIITEDAALIRIDQLPAVEEFFSSMYEPVSLRINEILSAECTEETRKEAEIARAEVRKFKADIKSALKKAEAQLYEPWEKVLEKASNLTNLCDKADVELKNRIDSVKNVLKKEKEDALREYHAEKCAGLGIDWLTYEMIAPPIRLNDTLSALRKLIDKTTERVASDVSALLTMSDSAEIMAEYKSTLDLSASVRIVQARRERTTEEAKRIEEYTKRVETERAESVQKASQTAKASSEHLSAPTAKSSTEEPTTSQEKRYNMTFTVTGTIDQLKALKRFIIENDITIIE